MEIEAQRDAFLDGRVQAWQPSKGYRAGVDTVMLAAAVPAKDGQSVLELGSGVGVAARCLLWRVPSVSVTCVEREPAFIHLARRNFEGLDVTLIEADVAALPEALRAQSFDYVMMNPPFFDHGMAGANALKSPAHQEDMPIAAWVDVARRRLQPRGVLTLIHRAERLAELVQAMVGFGEVTILPIVARQGRAAQRVIVTARKSAKTGSVLLPPFVMHDGAVHLRDGDDYSDEARAVLRDGAAIPLQAQ